ncbi:MAG: hypothetical protein ACREPR_13535 [Brasilonema sp.]
MRPGVYFGTVQTTSPYWLGTSIVSSKITLPGGIQLDASTFTAGSDGKRPAVSGTLVARIGTPSADPASVSWVKFSGIADPTTVTELAVIFHDILDVAVDNLTDAIAGNSGNILYYNYLPEWATLTAAQRTVVGKFFVLRRALP